MLVDIFLIFFLLFTLVLTATFLVNIFYVVPYVPTRMNVVNHLIGLAELRKGQKVYDLGCGDGRFLFEAEKRAHIKGTGYEVAPLPLILAHLSRWVNDSKVEIRMQSFYKADIKDADVIFCYLLPETMDKLRKKFLSECKKGTRIFSHTFQMKDMKPVKVWEKDPSKKLPSIYLYEIG